MNDALRTSTKSAPTTPPELDVALLSAKPLVLSAPKAPATRNEDHSLPPKPAGAVYRSLDLWRGAACLMLVCYHAVFPAPGELVLSDRGTWSLGALSIFALRQLWIGVPIFFVVSGYCIAASLDSLRRKPRSLGSYFGRRIRRIYPPLWAMVVLATLFTLLMAAIPGMSGCAQLPKLETLDVWNWFGNLTASESWLQNLTGGEQRMLMANTWTLCYEEQFYVVMGVVLLLSARHFFAASILLSIGTLVGRHLLRANDLETAGFFFDGHWLLFAAGILTYQLLNYLHGTRAVLAVAALVGGCAYGLYERVTGTTPFIRHLGEYLLVAHAFALTLVALKRFDARIAAHPLWRPLLWCGKRSYSIYLVHYPLVVALGFALTGLGLRTDAQVAFITLPLSIMICLPPSLVFYRYVETRFLNSPQVS